MKHFRPLVLAEYSNFPSYFFLPTAKDIHTNLTTKKSLRILLKLDVVQKQTVNSTAS